VRVKTCISLPCYQPHVMFSHTCGVHFDVLTVSFSTPAMFYHIGAQKLERKRSTRKMTASTPMLRTRLAIPRTTACGIMEDPHPLDVFMLFLF